MVALTARLYTSECDGYKSAEMQTGALASALRDIVGSDGVIDHPDALAVYDCDGYTLERSVPDLVVLPRTPAEVAAVVRRLAAAAVPFVPRGAGTGLSGGTLPVRAPVMVCTSRLTAIEVVDVRNRRARVQAGVVNAAITRAVERHGLLYVPDPSSQPACTIGGNVAENSGGPHTLKYGVTTNHVLGVELVLPSGEVVELGGPVEDRLGYDLTGIVVGSEGTFGVVTRAWLRLARAPQAVRTLLAVFETVEAASEAVSAIIGAGLVPAALEMMDRLIIAAVEEAFRVGLPTDAGAVLLVELDGPSAGLDDELARVTAICGRHGVREVRVARDEAERAALWKCRKRAFGAVGRLARNYCTQDGVVPRTRVPEILRAITAAAARHRLRIGNVFHAGDGNIHPILLFDERDRDEVTRVLAAGKEILEACVALGGSVTGEHGIGVEKIAQMPLLFSPDDLREMLRVRAVFDPERRANPHKIFPDALVCVEARAPRRQVPV
jgi:glycolate oxidase